VRACQSGTEDGENGAGADGAGEGERYAGSGDRGAGAGAGLPYCDILDSRTTTGRGPGEYPPVSGSAGMAAECPDGT